MKQNFIFGFRARGGEYHEHMGIAQLYELMKKTIKSLNLRQNAVKKHMHAHSFSRLITY